MANALASFPRCITIKVPVSVSPEEVGDYATGKAHEILVELGGVVLPRSISLRPISASFFALTFETNNQFTFKPKDDVTEPDVDGAGKAAKPQKASAK